MISYVLEHNGKFNLELDKWISERRYELINLEPIVGNNRKEIIITNYTANVSNIQNKKEFSEKGYNL